MTTDIRWTAESGYKASATLDGTPTFERLGDGMPDVQIVAKGGSAALLIRNGFMDKADRARRMGTLRGHVLVVSNGEKVADEDLSLADGTSVVYARPGPAAPPPNVTVDWLLRDCKGWPKATIKAVTEYFAGANPYYGGKPGVRQGEPDSAGSKEMTEYAWRGALGAALMTKRGIAVPVAYRLAAADRTRTAFWTPCGYYDEQGQPYRFSADPGTLVDEKGLVTTGHGDVDRPSSSPYQLADNEHFTLDGEWADAVLYNSPAAWLILDHFGEALCSRRMCRSGEITGNLRERARVIKALALLVGAFDDSRPQFKVALGNAYMGLVNGSGETPEGIPYAVPSPPKAVSIEDFTHVSAQDFDLAAHPEWSAGVAAEHFRAVIVPWAGAALTALEIVRDIPKAAACCPGLDKTADHLRLCVDYTREPGIDNDGQHAEPAPFHDSYAWKVSGRVKRANIAWGGTMDWCAQAMTPAEVLRMGGAKIGTATAVECYWPMLGLT